MSTGWRSNYSARAKYSIMASAYTMRVKRVMKSQKAQTVAKHMAGRFRKACQQVVDRQGAAADN